MEPAPPTRRALPAAGFLWVMACLPASPAGLDGQTPADSATRARFEALATLRPGAVVRVAQRDRRMEGTLVTAPAGGPRLRLVGFDRDLDPTRVDSLWVLEGRARGQALAGALGGAILGGLIYGAYVSGGCEGAFGCGQAVAVLEGAVVGAVAGAVLGGLSESSQGGWRRLFP